MAHAVPRAQELGRTSRSGNIRPQELGDPSLVLAINGWDPSLPATGHN